MEIDKVLNALIIKDEPSEKYLEYMLSHSINSVLINTANGYLFNSLNPYCNNSFIKKLKLYITVDHFDYSCLNKMHWLEELYFNIVYDEFYKFNFEPLEQLRFISIDWNKNIQGLESLNNLTGLHFGRFKGKIELFSNYPKMEDFALTQGNIKDLDFLKYFPKLKKLYLAYIPSLKNDYGLKYIYETVEEIDIEACPNLSIVNHLENFKNLKLLRLKTKEPIPNLKWAQKLPKLEFLAIGDTNIVDGDFTPVSDIKYVSMQDKKHYNYKFDREKWKIVPK